MALYYYDGIEEDGENAVIFSLELESLENTHFQPDIPAIYEPITTVLRKKEEDIWHEWKNSNETWQDSLKIVHSIRINNTIPSYLITIVYP